MAELTEKQIDKELSFYTSDGPTYIGWTLFALMLYVPLLLLMVLLGFWRRT